jgi:hypothetical protein
MLFELNVPVLLQVFGIALETVARAAIGKCFDKDAFDSCFDKIASGIKS